MKTTIVVIMKMLVETSRRKELRQTITSLLEKIEKQEGCFDCNFYCEIIKRNSFSLVQRWLTSGHLSEYLRTEHFKVLAGAMNNLLSVPPEITVYRSIDFNLPDWSRKFLLQK